MLTNIQIKALKGVRELIADTDNAFCIFDIDWVDWDDLKIPEDSFQGECGSPSCMLGWASLLPEEEEEALNSMGIRGDRAFLPKLGDKTFIDTPEWFTRKRTLAMLDHLIITHKVDWYALEKLDAA